MFIERATAARIDRAEARLSRSVAEAAAAPQALVRDVGGGLAVFARLGSPMNKLIGCGFEGPLDEGELAAVEEAFRARGEPVRAEVSTLVEPEVLAQLVDRGYRLVGFENVLGLALAGRAFAAPDGVDVALATAAELAAWDEATMIAWLHPDGSGAVVDQPTREVLEEAFADSARTPGFVRHLARIGGRVAAASSLRLDGGIAQLCGAATVPDLRRRGAQGALLAARLRHAQAEGCELAVVTTAPGSKSQANAQRHGFTLLYVRAVLVRS